MHPTTLHRLRTGLATIGAAALLVGGLNVASDAAGTAKQLLLGKGNKATKTTTLQTKKGPALSLKSKKGAALAIGSTALVKNLNADLVDGKSLDQLEPQTYVFNLGSAGTPGTGGALAYQTTSLPSGTYEFNVHGLVNLGAGDHVECAVFDATRFIASSGTDTAAIFAIDEEDDAANGGNVDSHGVGRVVSGNRLAFLCFAPATTTLMTPIQFTVKRLDRVAPVPGIAPTTFPKAARALARSLAR